MADNPYQRADEFDPRRCQAMTANGQCKILAVENCQYCIVHSGSFELKRQKAADLRNYRVAKYTARLSDKANSEQIKSIREEIAILRMLIEERLDQCHDSHDLLMHSTVLSDLIMKVEKLVSSCNRLETQLGTMLDKTQALQFASELIETIAAHVTDEDTLAAIADDVLAKVR